MGGLTPERRRWLQRRHRGLPPTATGLLLLLLAIAASSLSSAVAEDADVVSLDGECPLGGATDEGGASGGGCAGAQASGRSSLKVPRVIIGCWQLLERDSSRDNAVRTLTAYAEAGFDTFDTADIYGPSEAILGDFRRRWEAEHPGRAPLRFFTKYVTDDTSAEEARRVNGKSLKSLGIGAADLVQFHWWSLSQDASDKRFLEAARHLTQLRADGKIRHLAGCNMDTANLRALVEDGMPVEANQVQYSLLDRRPETQLLEYSRERGIKLTIFGVVAGGLLSDSFLGLSQREAQQKLDSVSRRMYWSSLQRWSSDWSLFQLLLQTLKDIGQRKAKRWPVAAVACAWALRRLDDLGAGGALILGVRDARHLQEHAALLRGDVELSDEDMAKIGEVLMRGTPPSGDIWYHERGWA